MNNKEFSEKDDGFKLACEKVKLPNHQHKHLSLARQAGKWRRKKGLAYQEGRIA